MPDVWTQRDGVRVPITALESDHLWNILQLFARKGYPEVRRYYNGRSEQLYTDGIITRAQRDSLLQALLVTEERGGPAAVFDMVYPVLVVVKAEAQRRGMEIPTIPMPNANDVFASRYQPVGWWARAKVEAKAKSQTSAQTPGQGALDARAELEPISTQTKVPVPLKRIAGLDLTN